MYNLLPTNDLLRTNRKAKTALLIALLGMAMIMALLPLARVHAVTSGATMTCNPTQGVAGTIVSLTSSPSAFTPGAIIYAYFSTTNTWGSGTLITINIPTGTGTYSTTLPAGVAAFPSGTYFTVPSVSTGTYYVIVADSVSAINGAISTTFTVVSSAPSLTKVENNYAPYSTTTYVYPGSSYIVVGTGFTGAVTIYLGYVGGSVIGTGTVGTLGTLSATVTMGDYSGGSTFLFAQDSTGLTASFPILVYSITTYSVTSISGAAGSTFGITGRGFIAGTSITANSITVGASATTESAVTVATNGQVSIPSVSLSAAISSTTTASGTGWTTVNIAGYYPSGTYPSILVSTPVTGYATIGLAKPPSTTYVSRPSYITANVSDAFVVYVWNFPASTSLTITFGSITLGTISTDSNGAGTLSTTVPATPAAPTTASNTGNGVWGSYIVNAMGSAAGAAANVYGLCVVVPYMRLYDYTSNTELSYTSPSLNVGQKFMVKGTGFQALDTILISLAPTGTIGSAFMVNEGLDQQYSTDATGSFSATFTVAAKGLPYPAAGALTTSLPYPPFNQFTSACDGHRHLHWRGHTADIFHR